MRDRRGPGRRGCPGRRLGPARRGGELPVTSGSLFAIGSTTKAFTASVVGALVDDGLLEWERPVRDYAPDLRLHDPVVTDRLTVVDLLSHRSGLPRHDLAWVGHPGRSRAELVRRLRFLPLSRDLRQEFQYCNLGYLAAGHLVEVLSGATWEDNLRSRLLGPLGMGRSNLSVDDLLADPDHATAYERRGGVIVSVPPRPIAAMAPAGAINSCASDMARWLLAQLSGGQVGGQAGIATSLGRLRWNHAIVTKVVTAMNVEIWSDVVCPWCYIGKRRFERALASFGHPDEVTVTYRSFELDPDAPVERTGTHAEHLARKYGMTTAQAEQANQQMTERAAADGLEFRFDLIRGGNTFDAHRLLHLAEDHGLQPEMKERLLRATFTEGLPIADQPTLVRLATEAGLPAAQVQAVLDGDAYADAVRADEQQAARYGITGVPFFVADGKYAVSGAQPPEVLLQLLQRAYAEASQLTPVAVTTDGNSEASCDGDSCAAG
jgi:predicted DsbA family dithiol-disulfide isomerase